jgi:hypothetical protein
VKTSATHPLKTIATLLDLSERRVQQLSREGVIPKSEPLYSAQTLCVTVKKSEAVPAKPHTYEKPDDVEERAI